MTCLKSLSTFIFDGDIIFQNFKVKSRSKKFPVASPLSMVAGEESVAYPRSQKVVNDGPFWLCGQKYGPKYNSTTCQCLLAILSLYNLPATQLFTAESMPKNL